jgi:hypothetical protein
MVIDQYSRGKFYPAQFCYTTTVSVTIIALYHCAVPVSHGDNDAVNQLLHAGIALRCSQALKFAGVRQKGVTKRSFPMAKSPNNPNRFGGPYLIQDSDHLTETIKASFGEQPKASRQTDQSQSDDRQQGGDDNHPTGQQGGSKRRRSR